MSESSKIEWTDSSWNPVTGCTKISPGCKNCYAERLVKRLQAMDNPSYNNGFQLTFHERLLNLPLTWKKPRMVFVNSMSDLFHERLPLSIIQRIFDVMEKAHWHTFQVLTKRSRRLLELNKHLSWPDNVWMGVSVESKQYTYRIENLRATNASLKFVSFEPLIGEIQQVNLSGLDWVIVGGESGPFARKMEKHWVLELKQSAETNNVPFFFKQWGGINKSRTGRLLEGRTWNEMPVVNIGKT